MDSTIKANDITYTYESTGKTTVNYTGATGFTATIEKGNLKIENNTITVYNQKPGTYKLTITTIPDTNHNKASTNIMVTVNKIETKITAPNIKTTYNTNKYLTITLKDNKNKPITGAKIKINTQKTYTTNKNGQIKINTKKWTPKTYTLKITYTGNETHKATQKTTKIIIKKATPKINAKNKTFKSNNKNKKYQVSLKDNQRKPMKKAQIQLKIGKTTCKTTTNNKGTATFKIKLTKTTNALIKYTGNKNYNQVTKKVKLTVKTTFQTISYGSKNHQMVKKIQKALKNNGYYTTAYGHYLKIDGIYHIWTQQAVKQYQKDKKLKITGKVDETTAKKLKII